jgi:hypothetical protein
MELKTLTLVIAYSDETDQTTNFLHLLQEIIKEYQVEIVGLWPQSSSGAWPEVTFLGEEASLERLRKNFYEEEDEESLDEIAPLEDTEQEVVLVKNDTRWEEPRKYISPGEGKFI